MRAPEAGTDRRRAEDTASSARRNERFVVKGDLRAKRLRRHALNLGLWTAQGWLAMFFIAAGWAKITQPIARLQDMLGWPDYVAGPFVRLFGAWEALLGFAVVAPLMSQRLQSSMLTATRTLLILAAVASAFHALRGPLWFFGLNAVVVGLCVLILVGRGNSKAG